MVTNTARWKRAGDLFTDEDRQHVADAIAAAESRTSAEIIPVVATVSGSYERAEGLVGITVAVVALAASWIAFQSTSSGTGDWGVQEGIALGLLPIILIALAGFIAGSLAARRLPLLRLAFVSGAQKRYEVEESAAVAYQRFRVSRTAASTGVLLYVSLCERMVRVMGDGAVNDKLGEKDWAGLRDIVIAGLRDRRPAEGICRAIATCGDLLEPHFPVAPGDVNEMTNELRLID